jgi:hypothetical protein
VIFPGNVAITVGAAVNGTIEYSLDQVAPVRKDEGFLIINPAPDGSDVLAADAALSAGYVNGLGLVSYDATAGEDIAELTSGLVAALDTKGYDTVEVGPGDILLLGQGAGSPYDLEYSLQPVGSANPGLGLEIATVVPEPASAVLAAGPLLAMALCACRRRTTRA